MNYESFIAQKRIKFEPKGFDVPIEEINPSSFGDRHQFQPHIVQWALRMGCAAVFAQYGFGKTRMQLEWAKHVANHTGKRVLILAPLAVARQTTSEGCKFGIKAVYCRSQEDADKQDCPIVVTNYEMLKHFDSSRFVGVVLDESAVLKQYRGKTKELLVKAFQSTPYRLCCSANPAPNDWLELGNHAEFLGIMSSHLMISRFFRNDTMKAGGYMLRPHAREAFWDWVASWAVCLTMPSDLGFSDDGWALPPLHLRYHTIAVDHTLTWNEGDRDGQLALFRTPSNTATSVHKEARLNAPLIAERIGEIVWEEREKQWAIWCFTDYESDALTECIPGAIALKGSEKPAVKQEKLEAFVNGEILHLITKPDIAGLGLNWQHCHRVAFSMGTSYSFEQFHQALHRTYRFGQQSSVETHLVFAETAGNVKAVIARKQVQFEQMQYDLRQAVKRSQLAAHHQKVFDDYNPTVNMELPKWLRSKVA